MSEASPSRWIPLVVGAVVLCAWVAVDLVPEWVPLGAEHARLGQDRLDDRLVYEMRYSAGWLTHHYREHGKLPDSLPRNRAAAGNGAVVELCPAGKEQLVSDQADWALCERDRAVRALSARVELIQGIGVPEKLELFPL